MYGHVAKLAEEIKKGAASVEGVEVKLWQVSLNYSLPCFLT
jgi:NAD(P)H dehydrogenase (quinone)